MVRIASGSTNPAKVKAVEQASALYFDSYEVIAKDVSSGVSNMPISKGETRIGAKNRALAAVGDCDLAVAHEGGICSIDGDIHLFSACVATDGKEFAWGGETIIRLPDFIVDEMKQGMVELGDIIEHHTGIENARQHTGATAYLTKNYINRVDIFTLHSIMALAYFGNGLQKN
ncbi:MAG: DUF84 family protein [Candidatus Heimdallarchaeota archaeon]|nr:DUF84 family protein [Candidatus Heimdallarchaeota archaeon]